MNDFKADLHVHSNYSDGSDSPEALLTGAKKAGLQGLSITDHDNIEVYEKALPLAQDIGIALLSGVEFSAMHKGESVHILGYSFSLKSKEIMTLCEHHRQRRMVRNLKILANLRYHGITLSADLFEGLAGKSWGRPHIAQALVEKGVVSSIQQAFDLYLGEGKKAYDPGESVAVEETIKVIQAAGGYAILAHPHLLKKKRLIKHLLSLKFDGLEGYYARLSPEQERQWIALALEKGWLVTGGSDYHGSVKPYSQIGSSWVNEATFKILYERFCTTNEDQIRLRNRF